MTKKIGILGGTFNPVHNGHIEIAKAAQKLFKLNKVVFVPSGIPPHKTEEKILDGEKRYKMLLTAIKGMKKFSASRIELDRKGYSYAVDTFIELKKKYGKKAKLYYIMGLDSINDILSWRKPLDLFRLCQFIVATRPGTKIRTFKRLIKFPPLKDNIDKIHLFEIKIDISSTEIRKKLKNRKSVKGMLPETVEKYIKDNKLYL